MGRKSLETITLYASGVLRLPTGYNPKRKHILVTPEKRYLLLSPTNAAQGLKPNLVPTSTSTTINILRVLKKMGLNAAYIAGDYEFSVDKQQNIRIKGLKWSGIIK